MWKSFHCTVLVITGGKGDTRKDVEIYPPSATCTIPSFPDTGKLSASSENVIYVKGRYLHSLSVIRRDLLVVCGGREGRETMASCIKWRGLYTFWQPYYKFQRFRYKKSYLCDDICTLSNMPWRLKSKEKQRRKCTRQWFSKENY